MIKWGCTQSHAYEYASQQIAIDETIPAKWFAGGVALSIRGGRSVVVAIPVLTFNYKLGLMVILQ